MEDIFLYLRWEEHWPWCSGGAQPQAGTRTVERTGGIFQPRFIMRLKCHFFLFPSKVMAGSSTAAAGLPGGLRLGCRRQGWHQNPLHDCRWYVSKLFVSCMANLAWRIGVMTVASLATSSPVYNLFATCGPSDGNRGENHLQFQYISCITPAGCCCCWLRAAE